MPWNVFNGRFIRSTPVGYQNTDSNGCFIIFDNDMPTNSPHVTGFLLLVTQLYTFMPHDFVVAVLQAATITKLITISTGTTSTTKSCSQIIVRKMPLPTAEIMPVGPFQLSSQPGVGSSRQATTAKKILH